MLDFPYTQGDFYLPGANVPEIFRIADHQLLLEHANDPKPILEPKEVPMPFIEGAKGVNGPLYVTEDWYFKKKKKEIRRFAKEERMQKIDMMKLLSQKDVLRARLAELDPTNKKDAKKIVSINVRIKDIDAELECLEKMYGIPLQELDHGTEFQRKVARVKKFFKKKFKKVKKWFHRNEELVTGVLGVVIPVVGSALVKKVLAVFA